MLPVDQQFAPGAAKLDSLPDQSGNQRCLEGGREIRGVFEQNVDGIRRGPAVLVLVNAADRGGRNRHFLAHEHVDHIDPVGEQIGHLAAAEIQIRAPVKILLRIVIAPF